MHLGRQPSSQSGRDGRLIHDFDSPEACQLGRTQVRELGAFCTPGDNRLVDITGSLIFDYDSPEARRAGLGDAGGGDPTQLLICTPGDNRLINRDGRLIHDFDSPEACQRGRDQAREFGAFCTPGDNRLVDLAGSLIFDYDSPEACRANVQ